MKMIKCHGKIAHDNPVKVGPSEDCFKNCFLDTSCLIAYLDENEECFKYKYTSLPKSLGVIDVEETNLVAIKSIIPETSSGCPDTYDSITLRMEIPSGDTYSWIKARNGYRLNRCRDNWKTFSRSNGNTVCMQIFQVKNIDQPAAKKFCMDREANLTGVASVEETDWIHGKLKEFGAYNAYDSFWIDGERKCTEGYECDTYIFSDGYTSTTTALTNTNLMASYMTDEGDLEPCITVAYMPDNQQKLNDIQCNSTKTTLGVVCGYSLL